MRRTSTIKLTSSMSAYVCSLRSLPTDEKLEVDHIFVVLSGNSWFTIETSVIRDGVGSFQGSMKLISKDMPPYVCSLRSLPTDEMLHHIFVVLSGHATICLLSQVSSY